MTLRDVVSCGLICAALGLAGCDDGRQAPGRVAVQVANAAPGFEYLTFRRERDTRNDTELAFKGAQIYNYDADTYDFHAVERTLKPTEPGRSWTFSPTLEADTDYTFVLTEVAGEVQPVVIPMPEAAPTSAQFIGLHAASGLPAMDLYLEAPGVGITGSAPRGTFGAQQQIPARTLPGGDYELFLTAAGNPANVLFTSTTITLPAATTSVFVVVPENGQGTAQISVILMQASPVVLFDRNATAELRAVNAALDQAPRDLVVDSQFSTPLHSAIPYVEPTPYAQTPIGNMLLNVTPVGNQGVLELNTAFTSTTGRRATMLFAGPAGALFSAIALDDGRRLNREAKLRFMNAVSQFVVLDYVVTFPDGDPAAVPTLAQLLAPDMTNYLPFAPGDYDLHVYQAGTANRLSGPTRISVAAGGIYGVLTVDGPNTSSVTVHLLDDFP